MQILNSVFLWVILVPTYWNYLLIVFLPSRLYNLRIYMLKGTLKSPLVFTFLATPPLLPPPSLLSPSKQNSKENSQFLKQGTAAILGAQWAQPYSPGLAAWGECVEGTMAEKASVYHLCIELGWGCVWPVLSVGCILASCPSFQDLALWRHLVLLSSFGAVNLININLAYYVE